MFENSSPFSPVGGKGGARSNAIQGMIRSLDNVSFFSFKQSLKEKRGDGFSIRTKLVLIEKDH